MKLFPKNEHKIERVIRVVVGASLWCRDVLERLSDYIDRDLTPERLEIEAHLAACDWCATFGGEFGAVVTAMRHSLSRPRRVDGKLGLRIAEAINASGNEKP